MDSIIETASSQSEIAIPPPAEPTERKRPGLAFLATVIFPGLGHVYLGNYQHAIVTAIFFTATAGGTLFLTPSSSPMYWGMCLRASIALYVFAFMDAYYSAFEKNAGISNQLIGSNPRIAAVLNLLTAGFGYFYLGEKRKGLIWFFASRILLGAGAAKSNWVAVIAKFAAAVVAVDAYRIARKQVRESLPPGFDAYSRAERSFSQYVPIGLASLLLFNYFALVALGLALPDYKRLDHSRDTATTLDSGITVVKNPVYGVSMELPAGWELKPKEIDALFAAEYPELGCQVMMYLHPSLPVSREGFAHDLEKEIRTRQSQFQWLSENKSSLGDKEAYALNYQVTYSSIPVLQRTVFLQHNLTLYALHEAASLGASDECRPMMDQIESSIHLSF